MVNNNGIPIEVNKKPFETVYELKDYEVKKSPLSPAARSKVVNKNGSNYVSDNKESYGPCFVCDLARNDPKWTRLRVVCPADDCPDRYKQREPTHWVHTRCWGDMEISIDGNIRCRKCYTSDFMGDWNFACSAHEGEHLPTSHTAFKTAVYVSMETGKAGEETGFLLYQFLRAHPEKFSRR